MYWEYNCKLCLFLYILILINLFDHNFHLDMKDICYKFYELALILNGNPKYKSGQ